MASPSTFIKLDRNILLWRWFKDANTFRVFVYLLLKANFEDHDFMDITIHRGELATSYATIAKDLEISIKSARSAISHLVGTREVAKLRHGNFLVISILNYDRYQQKGQTLGQTSGISRADQGQQYKNNKNDKEEYICLGSAHNVYLLEDQWEALKMLHGEERASELVEQVGFWLNKGNKSNDHYATIQYFIRRQNEQMLKGMADKIGKGGY